MCKYFSEHEADKRTLSITVFSGAKRENSQEMAWTFYKGSLCGEMKP